MRAQRIYLDTSVIGGCFDPEFAPWSLGLMKDFRLGAYLPVVSEVVAAEVADAPEPVRRQYAEVLALGSEVLTASEAVLALAESSARSTPTMPCTSPSPRRPRWICW